MIIRCKECQAEASDRALSCPNCGIPFPGISEAEEELIDKSSKYHTWNMMCGALFFVPILMLLWAIVSGDNESAIKIVVSYWPFCAAGVGLYVVGGLWAIMQRRKLEGE